MTGRKYIFIFFVHRLRVGYHQAMIGEFFDKTRFPLNGLYVLRQVQPKITKVPLGKKIEREVPLEVPFNREHYM
jgi:hypothetical protein